MTSLDQEIEAYDRMRSDLEEAYFNKWVVVRDGEVAGVFDGAEESLQFAAERFGRGPYLVSGRWELPLRTYQRPLCWGP